MDTQKLRQRILDLAIRGKLLPQDPNDEPASVLLDRIRAEKERLIAEGKLKRPKAKKSTDKSHYQNFTPPFDIPDSWEWVNIKEVTSKITDGTHHSPENKPIGDFLYITAKNIKYDGIKIDSATYVNSNVHTEIYSRCNPEYGDILYIKDGATAGVVAINDLNVPFSMLSSVALIKPLGILNRYLYYFLRSDFSNSSIKKSMKGVGITRITLRQIEEWNIPVPPYAEQERIVKILDNYFSILSYLEWNIDTLQESIHNAKSKILDLAMQGKLVPQNPSDEPAADMLRRINPKAKIITDNPQCRNLPLGWTLCQLRDLCSFLSRGKSPKYSETPNLYPVFAQKCNLKDGDISLSQARFLDETTIPKWPDKYRLRDGDVLVNSTGTGTVGRTRIFKAEYLGDYPFVVPDSHVSVVRSFDEIESTFIFYSLYCQDGQQYFDENLAGSTNQKELYIDVIGDRNIMLPPINEQKRIVAKIEELYFVLDQIEASLRS